MVRDWINKNYENIRGWLYNVAGNEAPDVFDDFIHDVIEIFMTDKKAEELIENGGARWYIVRIGLNQWRSNTSRHHKQYRPPFNEFLDNLNELEDIDYDEDKENLIETLLMSLDEMYEGSNREKYLCLIIIMYLSTNNNFSEMSRRLDVPRSTLSTNYKEGVSILKEKFEKNLKVSKDLKNIKVLNILRTNYFKNYGK